MNAGGIAQTVLKEQRNFIDFISGDYVRSGEDIIRSADMVIDNNVKVDKSIPITIQPGGFEQPFDITYTISNT